MQINSLVHSNLVICSSSGKFVTFRSSKISQFALVHCVGHTSLHPGLVPHQYHLTTDAKVFQDQTTHELPRGAQQR
jgi:hypothetical protein